MRRVWRSIQLLAIPTIALGVALLVAPDRAELEAHIWLLVVLGIAFLALMGVIRAAYSQTASQFGGSRRQPPAAPERPSSLARIEREVSIAASSAFDTHHRLRPTIQALATGLLSARRGIDLDRDPDRAHAVLGDDVWELVRPDRPQPTDKRAGGMDEARLRRIVTALERI